MSIISVGIICATIAIGSYAICKKLRTIIIGLSVIIDELQGEYKDERSDKQTGCD